MQATMTMHNNTGKTSQVVILLLIMAAVALSAHALVKHGDDAVVASQCADRPQLTMFNPETNRTAFICMTEKGWGVYIQARDGGNVSSFIKEKMTRVEQVIRYMMNRGYVVK